MVFALSRKIFKPLWRFFTEKNYREWLWLTGKIGRSENPISVRINGYKVFSDNAASLLNQYEQIFLHEIYLFPFSGNAPFIIDAGSNIGLSVLYFKTRYPLSNVVAFEADPFIFKTLGGNISEWNFEHVNCYNQAVWVQDTMVNFHNISHQGGMISDRGTITVKAARLRDLINSQQVVHLLKLDIEGAEYQVLADCATVLHKVQYLFVECHDVEKNSHQLADLIKMLQNVGFTWLSDAGIKKAPFKQLINSEMKHLEIFAFNSGFKI